MNELTGTRRGVMKTTGAALATAAVGSAAGCLGILGGSDYADWLPEPGTVGDGDHYAFSKGDHSALEDDEDEFDDDTDLDYIEETWAPADVNWEDVSMDLSFQGVSVIAAEFDREDVVEDFEDEDFDNDDDHEGYTVLVGPDDATAVAVGDDTLVTAGLNYSEIEDPVDAVEDVVDTAKGEEDRYVDESDAFDELVSELDDGDFVRGTTMEPTETDDPAAGDFENQVAYGQSWTVDGDETKGQWVIVFEDEDDVDLDDVEEWVETSEKEDGLFEDWGDLAYDQNGRSAVVTGVVDTDEM